MIEELSLWLRTLEWFPTLRTLHISRAWWCNRWSYCCHAVLNAWRPVTAAGARLEPARPGHCRALPVMGERHSTGGQQVFVCDVAAEGCAQAGDSDSSFTECSADAGVPHPTWQ